MLLWSSLGKHFIQLWRVHMFGRSRQAEMVQLPIRVAKPQHQSGLRTITGDADHGAVGRALPLQVR